MSRPLSTLTLAGWLFVSTAALMSCKKEPDAVNTVADEQPRILSMHIGGIPDNNIQIDQEQRTITVALPDKFKGQVLLPSFKLTPNSRVVLDPSGESEGSLERIYLSDISRTPYRLNVSTSRPNSETPPALTDYKLMIRQTGKLEVYLVPEPDFKEYRIGDPSGFLVIAENFYDGDAIAQLIMTRKGTTESITISNTAGGEYVLDAGAVNSLYPAHVRVRIPENVALVPGEYSLELKKTNGRSAKSPDFLRVRKGEIVLGTTPTFLVFQRSVGGQEVAIQGVNLFEDSNLEVELQHADGTILRRKPVRYNPTGTEVGVVPGAGAKPGHYRVRVWKDGQVASACYRLAVTRTADQPSIVDFRNVNGQTYIPGNDGCDLDAPLWVPRNSDNGGTYQLMLNTAPIDVLQLRGILKLVPVDPSQQVVSIPFQGISYTGGGVFSRHSIRIGFADSITPGLYRMSVAITDQSKGTTQESEPFERLINLR